MEHADQQEFDARKVKEMIEGYRQTCVLVAASQLRLFEHLARGAIGEDALARALSVDPRSLGRLLLALRSLSLVEVEGGDIALTAMGRLLVPHTSGIAEMSILIGSEYLQGWSGLRYSVETGKPAFEKIFGMPAWEHRKQHPELGAAFNWIPSIGKQFDRIVSAYNFSSRRHIVDIGGGSGYLLSAILANHAALRGTLFDLPEVVDGARTVLGGAGVLDRCNFVGGSFLDQTVPPGGDVYILKHVLHDWDDEICIAILANIRSVQERGGTLLVIEALLPDDDFHHPAARATIMIDLHMMTILGGRERRSAEYARLLAAAGFELTASISSAPCILEARAV